MQPVSLSTVFSAVVSGVLIFVLGQLLLKGILEPALSLKDRIAETSKQLHLHVHQRSYLDENYRVTENDIEIVGRLSAEIHSLPSRILLVYSKNNRLGCLSGLLRCLVGLPCLGKLQEASCKLNELSYKLRDLKFTQERIIQEKSQEFLQDKKNESIENIENLIPQIEKLLGITNPRQSPPSPSKNAQASR